MAKGSTKAPRKARVKAEVTQEAPKPKRVKTATTTPGHKAPEAQPTLAERKEAAAEQFATADATAAADARLRLAVSGF